MKKLTFFRKLVSSILVAIIVLGQFSSYRLISKAEVVTSGEGKLSLSLSETNENGNGYAFGMQPNGSSGKNIWSIVSSDGTHGSNLYCIRAEYSETWNDTGSPSDWVEYNKNYQLPLTQETSWTIADSILLGQYKNEILWLIDNLYIPGESNEEDYIKYLSDAGITETVRENQKYYAYAPKAEYNYTFISSSTDSFDETVTEEDIVAIQQMALWYYTNYGLNADIYNELKGEAPWLQYTTDQMLQTSTKYQDLENLSEARAIHATIIYNYLIDRAHNEAALLKANNEEYKLKKSSAKLWISTNVDNGTVKNEQPVIEVHKIEEKPFDLSLRKAIVKVEYKDSDGNYQTKEIINANGQEATRDLNENGSIETVDLSSLIAPGTTAKYNHRKDPIVVETGDKVTYAITIYNEAEEAGYANKIVDQLPGTWVNGLRLENNQPTLTSTAGNIYNVDYITSTNTITLTMAENSPKTVLAPYNAENGELASETILVECVVMAESDLENTKVLTNIAYIAEEYNKYFDAIITDETVQDRDSKTWEFPQANSLVTTDIGYTGNANNSTDLSSNDTYYAGIQDDDDFEKIVIMPKQNITVTKVWDDNNNQDGVRPTSIQIQLYADGVAVGEKVALTAGEDGIWQTEELKYTWTELPKYKDGNLIVYTVKELSTNNTVIENNGAYDGNYTVTYSEDTLTITNKYIPEETEITITKVWNDNNNQDGVRPTSIQIQLYADGVAVGEKVTLTAGEDGIWQAEELKHTWTELPKYKDGNLIVYTVKEISTTGTEIENNGAYDENYTATYSEDTLTITNTYVPEVTQITTTKVWNDNNNQDGVRPTSIQIQLYADGVAVGEKVTLIAGEDGIWQAEELKHTWTELPKYKDGNLIVYTVKEISATNTVVEDNGAYDENYTATYSEDTFTITNTHRPAETQVKVEKIWNDNNNQYGVRPNSIKVQLYANGEKEGAPIELKTENAWKYTWENLPQKQNGQNIDYTVKEINDKEEVVEDKQNYNKYYIATYTENENTTVITNTVLTFDLKLIKFITNINDEETENRIIKVDTSKLNTLDSESSKIITTAEYILEKNPVSVKSGDFVTYTLRVYNEGNYDGYATEISENIPEGLEFIVITDGAIFSWDGVELKDITEEIKASDMYEKIVEVNSNWGYKQDSSIITTGALKEDLIKGFGKENAEYADAENKIDYKEVQVIFRVKDDVEAKVLIRNEAAISADKAVDTKDNEVEIADRDSKTEEWNKENSDKTYDEEGKWPIYKEDDEDYDNIITKSFDLSLRKQIIQVNNALYTQRFAKLDDKDAYENTLYDYYDVHKNKVKVKAGDLVTYSIKVYNEGEIDGYASLIVDTIPSGLEFYSSQYNGIDYKWTLVEGTENVYQTDYLSYKKDTNKGKENSSIIKAYDGEGEANYKEIFIVCKVKEDVTKEDKLLNVAQIAEDSDGNGKQINDKDSVPGTSDDENKWKQEDDLDIEILQLQEFDLALRKFITQIENGEKTKEVTSRIPQVSYDEETKQLKYTHTKDALVVHVGDTVIYTLRVYNEGDIDGYASEIKDDIPEHLEFLPEHNTNKEYEWVMYDKDGNETDDVEKAVFITTKFLAKGNGAEKETKNANLLEAFDPESEIGDKNPDYKEVKVAFKVKDPNSTEYEIINFAQISKDTDSQGDPIEDKDSETDNGKDEPKEDDEDIEKVKVEYFDLSLLKYVTKVLVNENGNEKVIETGNIGDENDIIPHVQINKKNINNTVVKFVYSIRITNEGNIAGEATEITDYIPEGLMFVPEDNEHWTDEGNNVISTRQLTGSTMQPGESVEVEVVLRWVNGESNLNAKTNVAEISEDYNEENVPDKDSTPDNKKDGEDDIDDATVILSINQGGGIPSIYINVTLICLAIMLTGGLLIKKFVL